MKEQRSSYIKNILIPCVVLSAVAGILTGALIFLFKAVSQRVIAFSTSVYAAVREEPKYLPLAVLAAAAVGFAVALILKYAKDCRGGGIPTAVASIRGLIPLRWVQGIFTLFFSSQLTYLCGVPLGNEGPSVQMGAAIGKGTTELVGRKNRAWERYIMTGGACAGFAAATGASLTGILFALEEVHRRFSPMIFTAAAVSVLTGSVTQELLCTAFGVSPYMFDIKISEILPYGYFWTSLVIGAICGIFAVLFTKLYKIIRSAGMRLSGKVLSAVKIPVIFALVALFGFFSEDFTGSGHSLTEKLLEGGGVWYILIAAFVIRACFMISANSEGVSGGVFLPILTFGAIIGALCAKGMVAVGAVEAEYYPILVAVGMSSFLAVASRTPITALAFSAEALCGVGNVLPVGIAIVTGYIIIETVGIPSFNDTVMEAKVELENRGKTPVIVNTHMTVRKDSFAIGKEVRDILWPPTCAVLSVDKNSSVLAPNGQGLCEGDVLHIHYQTHDPKKTLEMFEYILGEQERDPLEKSHEATKTHTVPEG